MKLVRNTGADRVIDLVRPGLLPGHQFDIVTPSLSLFAFGELLHEARELAQARLLLPANGADLAFLGTSADRAARNRLQTPWLAEQLVQWLRDKAEVRRAFGSVPQGALVLRDKEARPRQGFLGSLAFAELTKERLRRAARKIKDENPLFGGDGGFRVFKLDSSNIRAWGPAAASLPETLEQHIEHLKADRTEADILYELLLKLGLDLCVPIGRRSVAGKDVHSIGGGVLLACLATQIARDEVEPLAQGIVDWHKTLAPAGDTTCVFRDSAFADDVAKTNLAAILNQHGLLNVRSL